VSGREVPIGGGSLSMVVPRPIASTSWSGVGHELSQQLGLLIPRLEDGGNCLGQGQWWGGFPFGKAGSRSPLPLRVFTILPFK
jgi:hypothetical protein